MEGGIESRSLVSPQRVRRQLSEAMKLTQRFNPDPYT